MGLFDLFKGGSKRNGDGKGDTRADDKPRVSSAVAKWADRAADKRAQNYDRQEAIAALAEIGTAEAAAVLLRRFNFSIDPSITDQDEKEAAFQGILKAGKDVLPTVRAYAAKAESLSWPMRALRELLTEDELVEELLVWLGRWDTEYAKFIDPKLQILDALAEHKHPKIREAVEPFLEDANESARLNALLATVAQNDEASVPSLINLLVEEESFRIKNRIVETFATAGWIVPDDRRDDVRRALPPGFSVDGSGQVRRRE
jgi:HEAT repeat protein